MATSTYHDDDQASEQSPFLDSPQPANVGSVPLTRRLQLRTLSVIFSLIFLLNIAGSLSDAPTMRITESIICKNHYKTVDPSRIDDHGWVKEKYCKVSLVQEELAILNGWATFFIALPGLFLSIPYGIIADKYGRKWLAMMHTVSICASNILIYIVLAFPHIFPIRTLWLQGVTVLIGGGSTAATALFFTIGTDVTSNAQRATVFFYAQALGFATNLVGPPLSSILMDRDPWIPMNLTICFTFLSLPVMLALPETLHVVKSRQNIMNLQRNIDKAAGISPSRRYNPLGRIINLLSSTLHEFHFLVQNWHILFLIFTAVADYVAEVSGNITLSYVSKRYTWPLSRTAYLITLRAVISVITLIAILPAGSTWLLKRKGYTNFRKEFMLSRMSFTFMLVGLFVEGFATSSPLFIVGYLLFALGAGTQALVRSLLVGLVQQTEVARLFSFMSVVSMAAMIVATPMNTELYAWGLRKGGGWIGMPFLVCGGIVAVFTVVMWMVRLEGRVQLPREDARSGREGQPEDERQEENRPVAVACDDLSLRHFE